MKKKLLVGAVVAGGAALALRRLAPAVRDMHKHCRELMHHRCGDMPHEHCPASSATADCSRTHQAA